MALFIYKKAGTGRCGLYDQGIFIYICRIVNYKSAIVKVEGF